MPTSNVGQNYTECSNEAALQQKSFISENYPVQIKHIESLIDTVVDAGGMHCVISVFCRHLN